VRDDARRQELLAATENDLIALAERVRKGRSSTRPRSAPHQTGSFATAASPGALRPRSPTDLHLGLRREGHGYEETLLRALCDHDLARQQSRLDSPGGRPLQGLQSVERRFRVLKDFLRPATGPPLHRKARARHVAICVLAAVIEAVMALDLARAKITDPDLEGQQLTARRALRELERIRMIRFVDANDNERQVITRPGPFQAKIPRRPRRPTPPPGARASPDQARSRLVGQKWPHRDLVNRTFNSEPPKSGLTEADHPDPLELTKGAPCGEVLAFEAGAVSFQAFRSMLITASKTAASTQMATPTRRALGVVEDRAQP